MRDLLQTLILDGYAREKCVAIDKIGDFVRINGATDRLPNTLSISFKNYPSSKVMKAISSQIYCSAGAACHSGSISHVLRAMNITDDFAVGTLRLSVGKMTTEEDIHNAAKIIISAMVDN